MTKKIYLEPLKSVLGRFISPYWVAVCGRLLVVCILLVVCGRLLGRLLVVCSLLVVCGRLLVVAYYRKNNCVCFNEIL